MKKNLNHIENELKNLKSIDYKMFRDADKWIKNAKGKLDNFEANNNNPNYIAFDMLENTKNPDDFMNSENMEDDLLNDDAGAGKSSDIITQGEKIAESIGKVKTTSTVLLAEQLTQLNLFFDEKAIAAINQAAKCNTIESVKVSQEELDAIREAVINAKNDDRDDDLGQMDQLDKLEQDMAGLNLDSKKKDSFVKAQQPPMMTGA